MSAADDTPAEGELANGCGKQYDRDYDYKGMAEALDFLVVMDYDSNSYPQDGKKEGPGGACDTCFFANDALPVVQAGVECYKQLGVPASKLVLAFPWCESLPPPAHGSRPVALMPRAAFQTGTTTLAPGPRRTLLSRATATSPNRRRLAWRPRRSYSRPPASGVGGSGTTSPRPRGSTVSPPAPLNARCWLLADLAKDWLPARRHRRQGPDAPRRLRRPAVAEAEVRVRQAGQGAGRGHVDGYRHQL